MLVMLCPAVSAQAQNSFSLDNYTAFLDANLDMPADALISSHMPATTYYSGYTPTTDLDSYAYFDSILIKYNLTADEERYLSANQFIITERLSFNDMVSALDDIYVKDLPVFISSDAILYALHLSYDKILMRLEAVLMRQNLADALDAMYNAIPELAERYADVDSLHMPLADADLFICIAKSLLDDVPVTPHIVSTDVFDAVWPAVKSEQYCQMPLFCERVRNLDFSQLTPRGHYVKPYSFEYADAGLDTYFRSMMWLGRIDFLMTAPEEIPPWNESDIRRMCYDAVLVNELLEMSGANDLLEENNSIIDMMVGKSDNLTPHELADILRDTGVISVVNLMDDMVYDKFSEALIQSSVSGQRILSSIFATDPFLSESMELPVSYRLMGQRFIVDSYIFSNLVYGNVIDNGIKILRLMPDPLDIMFALGNDDAVHLLEDELGEYPYAGELAAIRYLIDSYDSSYWDSSLYNGWLGAIRTLNPGQASEHAPYFTTTAAWRQSQLTTQLASWAQLRHDTILYGKQSYTEVVGCSYPHSYVEPNPAFFRQVMEYAENAEAFFLSLNVDNIDTIVSYFSTLYSHMSVLASIAEKELAGERFSEDEEIFLSEMIIELGGACGPSHTGWYFDLIINGSRQWKFEGPVIADVHTQSSDEHGNMVGKVLHVATGNINLGVFLAESPSNGYQPMAYVGPVQSYYEKTTTDFKRYTDEEWCEDVTAGAIPEPPDWVNCYLADSNGNRRTDGRMLPSISSPLDVEEDETQPVVFDTVVAYPNPFNPATKLRFTVAESGPVTLSLYTVTGQQVAVLIDKHLNSGTYEAVWNADGLASGVYFCHLVTARGRAAAKVSLVR